MNELTNLNKSKKRNFEQFLQSLQTSNLGQRNQEFDYILMGRKKFLLTTNGV